MIESVKYIEIIWVSNVMIQKKNSHFWQERYEHIWIQVQTF